MKVISNGLNGLKFGNTAQPTTENTTTPANEEPKSNKKLIYALAGLAVVGAAGVGIALAVKKGKVPPYQKEYEKLRNEFISLVEERNSILVGSKEYDKLRQMVFARDKFYDLMNGSQNNAFKNLELVGDELMELPDGSVISSAKAGSMTISTLTNTIQNSIKKANDLVSRVASGDDLGVEYLDADKILRDKNCIPSMSENWKSNLEDLINGLRKDLECRKQENPLCNVIKEQFLSPLNSDDIAKKLDFAINPPDDISIDEYKKVVYELFDSYKDIATNFKKIWDEAKAKI